MSGPVICMKGCGKEWPRDPVLEVACPDCGAAVGVKCKRPSGHAAFAGAFHRSRDLAADAAGAYGPCPLNCCGLQRPAEDLTPEGIQLVIPGAERVQAPSVKQMELF